MTEAAPPVEAPATPALKRIAIFGLAPSTRDLAPSKADFDGQRWTLNDGHVYPHYLDCDVWFDLHPEDWWRNEMQRRASGHVKHLREFQGRVYMQQHFEDVPNSVPYPKDEVLAFFGRRYFTSTIAWMLALAVMEKPDELWLWGVDLAGSAEYSAQRPAAEWLLGWAEGMGIKVMLPEACPLLRGTLYGMFDEEDPGRALLARQIENEHIALKQMAAEHNNKAMIIQGRLQEAERIVALVKS